MPLFVVAVGPGCASGWEAATRALLADGGRGQVFGSRAVDDKEIRLAAVASEDAPPGAALASSPQGDVVAVADGNVEGTEPAASAVLRAYRARGLDGLTNLRGEYAFALWDGPERCLWAGCDPVGLRAPAYSWDGGTFVLGSRAIGLLRHGAVSAGWDPAYLAHAVSGLWTRKPSGTAYRGLRRMVGGELLRVMASGVEHFAGPRLQYASAPLRDRDAALAALGERIDRAVVRAAGPGACVALSGGLDSSVVACALAQVTPAFDGFSVVAPAGSAAADRAVEGIALALPGLRVHRVPLPAGAVHGYEASPLPDDPVCTGPAFQPARNALFRAVREHGFLRLLDGEGGDELFDLAWLLGDLVRVGALDSLVPALASRGTRARLFRDLALPGLLGPWSKVQPARVRRRIRQRRPWVRSAFWASACFDEAWEEAMAYARRPSARARIPQILGAHGRYWRAQMLAKGAAGIEGASPLLAREVVELVGSLHPRIAMNPRHSKWLLRKHAERRLPAAVAWRPKSEPMNDWLVRACVSQDANVARAIANIRSSPTLSDLLDTEALVGAVQECRSGARERLEAPLAELFAFVEWAAAVEARHGF